MPKYTPTIEEVKEAIDNARKILEGYFPHVSEQDVAKFRSVMRKRLHQMYKEKEILDKDNDSDKKEWLYILCWAIPLNNIITYL